MNYKIGDEVQYIGDDTRGILIKDKIYEVVELHPTSGHFYVICEDRIKRWSDGTDFELIIPINTDINFLDMLKGY